MWSLLRRGYWEERRIGKEERDRGETERERRVKERRGKEEREEEKRQKKFCLPFQKSSGKEQAGLAELGS